MSTTRGTQTTMNSVSRLLVVGLALSVGLTGVLSLTSCGGDDFEDTGKQLVVVGIDGMDPKLTQKFIAAGLMPNFEALAAEGTLCSLGTSNPPQSPVAWSNFITGMNPGGHGVYDFLHLDPERMAVTSSTQTAPPVENISIPLTHYQFPSPFNDEPEKIQQGIPFWEHLEDAGVRASVYRMPAAYPLTGQTNQVVLSDMGTPDLLGGMDGTYSFYYEQSRDELSGNKHAYQVYADDGAVYANFHGLPQPFLEGNPVGETPFEVHLHPTEGSAYVSIDGADGITIREGEWSDWVDVYFDLGMGQSINAMVHFYLRSVRPFELYVSPFNIDPLAPAQPISLPDDDAIIEIAESTGRFYTMGLAEETKGLEDKVLDDEDFIKQCDFITEERRKMLDYALDNFDDGLLFFYFSSIDLRCHMMFRHTTDGHPAADPEGSVAAKIAQQRQHYIRDAYVHMDNALGHLRQRLKDKFGDEVKIIVMSDHGFAPYTRQVHLNRWLHEQGYLAITEDADDADDADEEDAEEDHGPKVDWEKTRVFAMGFNSVYVNRWDFDVSDSEAEAMCEEIRGKLLQLTDPERDGAKPIRRCFLRDEIYSGGAMDHAPDMIVGYDAYYGSSDKSALGRLSEDTESVFEDNTRFWSGNHLMDPEVVPGVLCTNLEVLHESPDLRDLTATLLHYFDVEVPSEVEGTPIY